ncbi:hypothetical protein GCM10017044_20000 [Kordiimonas sediminis]|uniref:Phosphatidate cytidylyltransferase n=1 Tax=Kordiimonas sediminis TaxID=1735581 RepID=A0A919ATX4_9PROT|nr:hypothetical protein [Kordiimonas sediminis]GHF25225.1 hypothetical protein GCM10017044_20000 [Kordiimonas sediminis]
MTIFGPNDTLCAFILDEWTKDVPKAVVDAAEDIARRYGDSVEGVLFYGSCLRTGEIEEKILDFYVIVKSYRDAYSGLFLAAANKILPPNVFYHEMDVAGITIRSKYAVLSREDLHKRSLPTCLNVSVWARFCQPCKLLLSKNEETTRQIAGDVGQTVLTMLSKTLPQVQPGAGSREVWVAAFENTYASELRSERSGKGLEIYLLDQDRYDRLSPIAFDILGHSIDPVELKHQPARWPVVKNRLGWFARRINGKLVSFLRLIKASMTFDGGIDYLAWKIKRHSGVEIEIKDWMRRHQIIAGLTLFWSSRKKGAFK